MTFDAAVSPRARRWLAVGFAVAVVFLYTPLVVMSLLSVNDSPVASLPLRGLTTRWFAAGFSDTQLWSALATSALVAVTASGLALAMGLGAALVLSRSGGGRAPAMALVLLLAPLIMPFLVVGALLLILFAVLAVPLSAATVVVGHALVTLPYAVLVLLPRLSAIDPRLREAALDLGASPVAAFRLVTAPLVAPALVSGFVLGLSVSFDEFPIASLLAGPDVTFPIYLYARLRLPEGQAELVAVATGILLVTFAVGAVAELVRSPRLRGRLTGWTGRNGSDERSGTGAAP